MLSVSNWSFRAKAAAIPGVLSALVVLLGMVSYLLLSSTNQATESVGGNWLPSAHATLDIEIAVARLAAALSFPARTRTVAAAEQLSSSINEIGHLVAESARFAGQAAAVDQQNAATGEIARNGQQAAQGTSEVSSSVGQLAEGAAQTGDASVQLLQASENLGRDAQSLRDQIDGFLGRIKAA